MMKIVSIIMVIAVFSFFAFPIFWRVPRENLTPSFVYNEFQAMVNSEPIDFVSNRILKPSLEFVYYYSDKVGAYFAEALSGLVFGESNPLEGLADGSGSKFVNVLAGVLGINTDVGPFELTPFGTILEFFNYVSGADFLPNK